jgi:hypothetical protein
MAANENPLRFDCVAFTRVLSLGDYVDVVQQSDSVSLEQSMTPGMS